MCVCGVSMCVFVFVRLFANGCLHFSVVTVLLYQHEFCKCIHMRVLDEIIRMKERGVKTVTSCLFGCCQLGGG